MLPAVGGEGAGGGTVVAGPVQHHLDQGPVLGGRPLEHLGLLGAGNAVHGDVAVLTRNQDVLPGPSNRHQLYLLLHQARDGQ